MKNLFYGIVPDASSKTRVRCVFCGVYIPKASKCIEQHTKGTKHKENIQLMTEHAMSFNNVVLHCNPCNHILADDESVTKHIESDDHANWMAAMEDLVDGEFIKLEPYLSSEKDCVLCEVCDCDIESALVNVEEHVNSFNHRANVCKKLKPLNGIFQVDNNEEVWCKICDEYIVNSVTAILDHIDDDEHHMNWFTEVEDLIENQDVSIESYLSNEHENKAYCHKCQTEFVCDVQNIEIHVNSEAHLNHYLS